MIDWSAVSVAVMRRYFSDLVKVVVCLWIWWAIVDYVHGVSSWVRLRVGTDEYAPGPIFPRTTFDLIVQLRGLHFGAVLMVGVFAIFPLQTWMARAFVLCVALGIDLLYYQDQWYSDTCGEHAAANPQWAIDCELAPAEDVDP